MSNNNNNNQVPIRDQILSVRDTNTPDTFSHLATKADQSLMSPYHDINSDMTASTFVTIQPQTTGPSPLRSSLHSEKSLLQTPPFNAEPKNVNQLVARQTSSKANETRDDETYSPSPVCPPSPLPPLATLKSSNTFSAGSWPVQEGQQDTAPIRTDVNTNLSDLIDHVNSATLIAQRAKARAGLGPFPSVGGSTARLPLTKGLVPPRHESLLSLDDALDFLKPPSNSLRKFRPPRETPIELASIREDGLNKRSPSTAASTVTSPATSRQIPPMKQPIPNGRIVVRQNPSNVVSGDANGSYYLPMVDAEKGRQFVFYSNEVKPREKGIVEAHSTNPTAASALTLFDRQYPQLSPTFSTYENSNSMLDPKQDGYGSPRTVNRNHHHNNNSNNKFSGYLPTASNPSKSESHSDLTDLETITNSHHSHTAPISQIYHDVEWSLQRLMNERIFEQLLHDQMGRLLFRKYLDNTQHDSTNKLDLYIDLDCFVKMIDHLRVSSQAIHDIYLSQHSKHHVPLSVRGTKDLYNGVQIALSLPGSIDHLQNHLLHSMYQHEFQKYIKSQLVEHAKIRLGKLDLDDDQVLGDSFCLTNPRLVENPIVLVSDGFVAVTGYPKQAVIGRNCRFLQGPGTCPNSVGRIRDALYRCVPICELLLNYRRDGQPFWCLLNMIPLRDNKGKVLYFIGGQTNVTSSLVKSKGISFLIAGSPAEDELDSHGRSPHSIEISPTMADYLQNSKKGNEMLKDMNIDNAPCSDLSDEVDSNDSFRKTGGGMLEALSGATGLNDELSETGETGRTSKLTRNAGAISRFLDFIRPTPNLKLHSQELQGADMPQELLGAENNLRRDASPLEDQMRYFSGVYSKLLVFKRKKREIIFITKGLLQFLEYPHDTKRQVYNSSLLHTDLLNLVGGRDTLDTKVIHRKIKDSIEETKEFSVTVALRSHHQGLASKLFGRSANQSQDPLVPVPSKEERRWIAIHATPLKDGDGGSFAFVAIFVDLSRSSLCISFLSIYR